VTPDASEPSRLTRAAGHARNLAARPVGLVLAGLVLNGLVFGLFPELDLALAALFFDPATGLFAGRADPSWNRWRTLGFDVPYAVFGLFAFSWLLGLALPKVTTKVSGRALAFLALSLALGPGLLVNGVLKEVSQRPRPVHVTEFRGPEQFRPWYSFDGACRSNCSFVSGEASSATWLIAPASLAPPPFRAPLMAAALGFGAGVGLLRMGYGGHFASDVIFSILLTLLIVAGSARLTGVGPARE
jgi:membrane-associated PAP2 superfamily phosphatase